jgi:hypothetical protein
LKCFFPCTSTVYGGSQFGGLPGEVADGESTPEAPTDVVFASGRAVVAAALGVGVAPAVAVALGIGVADSAAEATASVTTLGGVSADVVELGSRACVLASCPTNTMAPETSPAAPRVASTIGIHKGRPPAAGVGAGALDTLRGCAVVPPA